MKIGDVIFWEEGNYMGHRLEKVTVTKISSNFVTVKTIRGNEKRFNLKTMCGVGREKGMSSIGGIKYELMLPTLEIEHEFEVQTHKDAIKNMINKLSSLNISKLTDSQVTEYYNKLSSFFEVLS